MFIVTVEGQYYAQGKVVKNYKYECQLPNTKKAMSVIKNKIAERKLQRLYEDFVAVRTYAITDIRTADGKPAAADTDDPFQMTIDQLKDTVLLKKLPIHVEEYRDIIQLRQDVHDAIKDVKSFLANKVERDAAQAEDNELLKLNPDLSDVGSPTGVPIAPPIGGSPVPVGAIDPIQIENPDDPFADLG